MRKLVFVAIGLLLVATPPARATQARITRLIKEVKIVRPRTAPHSASRNETLPPGATIQTSAASQVELRLDSGTLVRLGANSLFRLDDGARPMELLRGAILARAPKGLGETRIVTGDVVSAVQGTTSLLEFYPQAYTKLIALDGTVRMFMPRIIGESVLVEAGQLLMFQAKAARSSLPNPVDIDLKRMIATSLLIQGFPPLGSESSIAQGVQSQKRRKSEGALADTNLVIFGRGTLVSLVPPEAEQQAKKAPSPSPSPASSRR